MENKEVLLGAAGVLVIGAVGAGAWWLTHDDEKDDDDREEVAEIREDESQEEEESVEGTVANIASVDGEDDDDGDGGENRTYRNGTYSAVGTYNSPQGLDELGVTVTVENDEIVNLEVERLATRTSAQYQNDFIAGIDSIVVGEDLETDFDVARVNGSSLTGTGFTDALNQIREEAENVR